MIRRRLRSGHILALMVALVSLAGCGESGKRQSTTPTVPRPVAVTHVATVSGKPARTKPLRAVQVASVNVPNLSWLTSYGRYVWVKRDDGFVTRVDPRSNQAHGKIGSYTGSEDNYCQGIGAGGGAVWSCTRRAITRIDPAKMKIVASIPVLKVFDQGRLVFANGRLWVITGRNGDQLTGIDAATNRPDPPIKLPVGCSDLAQGGPDLWVLCGTANRVVKVDAKAHRVTGQLTLSDPEAGYATATDLWVSSKRGLLRVDSRTLKPIALIRLNAGQLTDVVVDGDHVWVRIDGGFLYRVDRKSNSTIEQIKAGGRPGGGSLLVAHGALWTTADQTGELLRLRANG